MLKAKLPVLYRSTQYKAGDALPADDAAMVEAWLGAGSAAWVDDEEPVPENLRKRNPQAQQRECPDLVPMEILMP